MSNISNCSSCRIPFFLTVLLFYLVGSFGETLPIAWEGRVFGEGTDSKGDEIPAAGASPATQGVSVDRRRLEGIDDDSPLSRSGDKEGWDYLFGILRRESAKTLDANVFATVGFTELDRQSVEYRGQLVKITGRMVRCLFVQNSWLSEPFGEGKDKPDGFYEAWVVVDDSKNVPISVCSLEVPEGFPLGEDLSESVSVVGFFYKRRLFLTEKNEEVSAPTLLAKTFHWTPGVPSETGSKTKDNTVLGYLRDHTTSVLILLAGVWLILRMSLYRFGKESSNRELIRARLSGKGDSEEKFDGVIRIPDRADSKSGDENSPGSKESDSGTESTSESPKDGKGDLPKIIVSIFVLISLFACSPGPLRAQESDSEKIDSTFTRTLLKMDDLSWDALGDETIPLDQQKEPVLEMVDRLRRSVPAYFLQQGIQPKNPPFSMLISDSGLYRGKAFQFQGRAVRVEEVSLNPAEKKAFQSPAFYRCRVLVDGEFGAEVLVPQIPDEWKPGEPMDEKVSFLGIYIKKIPGENARDNAGEAESGDSNREAEVKPAAGDAASEIFETKSTLHPLFVAPRIQWFPDTLLGNLGMDVGTLDRIPILRISDLKKKDLDVPASLRLLDRGELIRRAFKFTDADRDPFYGLLKAASGTSVEQLVKAARELMEKEKRFSSAVPLFTKPELWRGKPVLLYGTAKRVIPTLVEDKEVRLLYGIEKYYQIYFYTDDSQGNPLIVCVTKLPDGMPTGSGPEYSEQVSIPGFFYKLWVYESSALVDHPGIEGEKYKPNYAPLLIGNAPIWFPKKPGATLPPGSAKKGSGNFPVPVSFAFVAALLIIWLFLYRFRSRKNISFRLRR